MPKLPYTTPKDCFKMSKCVFCDIAQKQSPATVKLDTADLIVFEDIKPAATHHYLSVPKRHIDNVHSLSAAEHRGLLDQLIEAGRTVVQQNGGDLNDLRLGFHLPPFNSVGHLHLHVISPAAEMSFLHRLIFRPNTWWFASVEQIQQKLAAIEDSTKLNNKL